MPHSVFYCMINSIKLVSAVCVSMSVCVLPVPWILSTSVTIFAGFTQMLEIFDNAYIMLSRFANA